MFEAFAIGPFIIWTRVLFLLLGIILSTEFFIRLARGANLSLQHMQEHSLYYGGAFLLAGRLIAIITEYRVYIGDPLRIFIVWDGGFSFLGGAIGIALVLFLVTRHYRTTFLQWLDILLPALSFGLAFSWFGEFASGHAYGIPTDMPWGVVYDTLNVRYTVPIHPVQLYYSIFYFILTFVLLIVRKYSGRAGAETLIGIVLAAIATFFFEYFRGDFSIPVFATQLDFLVLVVLFASLFVFAAVELALSKWGMILYETLLISVFGGYIVVRPMLALPTYELRFSQFLAVLALFATVVYVLVHRRRYPHL
ncbi:MAG: prolipoprotein diacylglyceryl transferase family protein [Candidatus Peregrinibacteria bacterium]